MGGLAAKAWLSRKARCGASDWAAGRGQAAAGGVCMRTRGQGGGLRVCNKLCPQVRPRNEWFGARTGASVVVSGRVGRACEQQRVGRQACSQQTETTAPGH